MGAMGGLSKPHARSCVVLFLYCCKYLGQLWRLLRGWTSTAHPEALPDLTRLASVPTAVPVNPPGGDLVSPIYNVRLRGQPTELVGGADQPLKALFQLKPGQVVRGGQQSMVVQASKPMRYENRTLGVPGQPLLHTQLEDSLGYTTSSEKLTK